MLSLKSTITQITSYRLGYTSQRPYPWRRATPTILVVFLLISVFLAFLNVPLSAYEIVQDSTYRPNDTLPPLLFSKLAPGMLQSPADSFEPHVLTVGDTLAANNSLFNLTIIGAWDVDSSPVASFSYYNNPLSDGCDISNLTITAAYPVPDIYFSFNVVCRIPTLFQMNSGTIRAETLVGVNNVVQNVFQSLYHLARLELGIIMENQIFDSPLMFNESISTVYLPDSLSDLTKHILVANESRASTSNLMMMKEWANTVHLFKTTDRVPVINYLRPVPRPKPMGSAVTSVFVSTFAMVSVLWTVFSLVAGIIAARSENASTEGGARMSTMEDRIDTYGIAIAQMELSLARVQFALNKRGLLEENQVGSLEASIACTTSISPSPPPSEPDVDMVEDDVLEDAVLPFPHDADSDSDRGLRDAESESNWDYDFEPPQACSDDEPPVQGNLFDSADPDDFSDILSTASSTPPILPLSPDGDEDPWSGFDEFQDLDEDISLQEMVDALEDMVGPDEDVFPHNDDQFGVEREARKWDERNIILTEQDRDNIRAFNLKLMSQMPRTAYNQMVYSFRHKLELSSEWVTLHRVAILARVEPIWSHCCVNSCVAYLGRYKELDECPYCDEPRLSPTGKPRRMFAYLPIIPRLQGLFQNPKSIEQLLYRHNYTHTPGIISDVFDSEHYRTLCKKNVVVDGKTMPYRYFSGKYDLCFGLCTDSYLLFKRRRGGPSATPFLVQNYCIHPATRTHTQGIGLMSAGVVPGPHPPKDMYSFSFLFDDECAQLAVGVRTYNALDRAFFNLRGYNIFEMGDIIAIEKSLNIKGHNGFSPCRSCEIKGVRDVAGGGKIYYVPLTLPDGRFWDPTALPLRSPQRLDEFIQKLTLCTTETARKKLTKFHGIKGLPALRRVGSSHYGRSNPWEFLHLFIEGNVLNLIRHWTGRYKGLDSGVEDYEIPEATWDIIWQETAAAVQHLPADFVRALGSNPTYYNAEAWCFWFVYLAPVLLEGRFSHPKYYKHACQFGDIIKFCLRFKVTHAEVEGLRQNINDWVHKYEKYYYQYSADRLSACPLIVHGLVHVPDDILFCGPLWCTWSYWMERYCGILQAALRSRSQPWANLNKIVLHHAYLEQLGARYDLAEELAGPKTRHNGLARGEFVYHGYPEAILRLPYKKNFQPDDDLRAKAARYFADVLGEQRRNLIPLLPDIMPSYGKLRIVDGDSIRTASACGDGSNSERNMSFIRYEIQTRRVVSEPWVSLICYGRLERILVCKLPNAHVLGTLSGKQRLLAVITPCKNTGGKDAALQVATYRGMGSVVVVDLHGLIRPEFVEEDED
ncbi:hypothetical protein C8R46DRAFT_1219984 [Mycena filopes]|nr:hypothetical protein C8R46DRAFT_1219984 [Mycena filopes]